MLTRESVKAKAPVARVAYRVEDFLVAFGIGRTMFYKEVKAGRLVIVKVGKATLISVDEAERWWRARCGEGVANV